MSVTFTAEGLESGVDADGNWEPNPLEVNMCNGNAVRVAEALGIDLDADGWCGGTSAEDFQGRVVMALALSPVDEGMPSFQLAPGDNAGIFGVVQEGGPRIIQGARRPGYLQERLGQLHELAQWATANEAEVQWS